MVGMGLEPTSVFLKSYSFKHATMWSQHIPLVDGGIFSWSLSKLGKSFLIFDFLSKEPDAGLTDVYSQAFYT